MSITWRCACGKGGKVPDEKGGKKGKCPACGNVIHIPLAAPALPPPPPPPAEPPSPFDSETFEVAEEAEAPVRQKAVTKYVPPPPITGRAGASARQRTSVATGAAPGPARPRKGQDHLYLLTLLALIPLGISLFRGNDGGGIADRLTQTVNKHPEVAEKVQEIIESDRATLDQLFKVLPGQRLAGSFLARDTVWHWVFALLSAAAFMGLMTLMFPPGHAARTHLLWTGVFTATAGILVLLAFQFIANATDGMWVRGRGLIVLFFYAVKFIGFSYQCAEDPTNSFWLSFLGFTLGVGLCEEIVKAIPLMWHFKTYGTLKWKAACLWGRVVFVAPPPAGMLRG